MILCFFAGIRGACGYNDGAAQEGHTPLACRAFLEVLPS